MTGFFNSTAVHERILVGAKSYVQALHILAHHLRRDLRWRRSTARCSDYPFHDLHEIFSLVAPSKSRAHIFTYEPDVQKVMRLDSKIE